MEIQILISRNRRDPVMLKFDFFFLIKIRNGYRNNMT